MIVYRRMINMVPGGQTAVVNMSQYDSDVILEFELYASEGTFVVDDGTTVLIRGTKPDGNGISLDAELESTQDPITGQYVHLVTVEVTQQMTAVAGKALYELSLRKDDVELNTANFILDIERAPLDADTVPSESVIREIGEAVNEYMEEHDIVIDDTLTQQGRAADAKKTGDEITAIKAELSEVGLPDEVKNALLTMFRHVVFLDTEAEDAYLALEDLLFPTGEITVGPQALIVIQKAQSGYPVALLLYVKPIQDFNGYDKPWTEGKGKNICNYFSADSVSGLTISVASDGKVTIQGTATGTVLRGVRNIAFDKDCVYYMSGDSTLTGGGLSLRNSAGNTVTDNGVVFGQANVNNSPTRIISSEDLTDMQFLVRVGSGSTPSGYMYPLIIKEGINNHAKGIFASGEQDGLSFTASSSGIITISGTIADTVEYTTQLVLSAGDYTMGGNRGGISIKVYNNNELICWVGERGGRFTLANETTLTVAISCDAGTYSNKTIMPSICDAIENTDYAPYSNICPFTQISQVEMKHGASQNSYDTESFTIPQGTSYYGGIIDFVNQTFRAYKHYASYSGQTLSGKWLSSMEEYEDETFPTSGAEVIDLEAFDSLPLSVDKIALLLNKNVLWSDDGDILLTYIKGV